MFTMEPRTQKELIRHIFDQMKEYRETSANAYLIAVTALDLYTEQDEPVETCIELANLITSIPLRNDEPRFSVYDYMDAVANSTLSPGYQKLIDAFNRQPKDSNEWDSLIIALTEHKRFVYNNDWNQDALVSTIRAHLKSLGIQN